MYQYLDGRDEKGRFIPGRKESEEQRLKKAKGIKKGWIGRVNSEKHKQAMVALAKDPEWLRKVREASKKREYKTLSYYKRKKISAKLKELWKNKEYRENMVLKSTGRKHSKESVAQRALKISGNKSYSWKGDDVGNHALHNWVKKTLGKPTTCEFCKKTNLTKNQIHWANKSGKYRRRKYDWLRLCMSCHMKYDFKNGMRNNKKK